MFRLLLNIYSIVNIYKPPSIPLHTTVSDSQIAKMFTVNILASNRLVRGVGSDEGSPQPGLGDN